MGSYTAPPISMNALQDARRVELVFRGVEQAGPSFEARVYLNNPDADETTQRTPEAGYAGSFHVYGYGEHPPPPLADAKARQAPVGRRWHRSRSGCEPTRPHSGERSSAQTS